MQGIAGGLPMLLIFAAFFGLTAETWQVVVVIKPTQFVMLMGILVALTVGVLYVLARQQLRHAEEQLEAMPNEPRRKTWGRLREQALREEPSGVDTTDADAVRQLFGSQPQQDADLSPHLTRRMKLNALLVVAVFQALVFVPVGLGAMGLLWVIGRLTVPEEVAAQWVYGDNADADDTANIDALNLWDEPWTRVPMILAAFAVLYLTVQLLTNEEQRGYFFSAANSALQQRLAVRIAYHNLHFRDHQGAAPNGKGGRGQARRSTTTRAATSAKAH